MNIKAQKTLLFIFLLTGLINNSCAKNILLYQDTITNNDENNYFKSKIDKSADDSIRIDVNLEKIYLYGNATIKYENTNIVAGYIEIDWNKNTIYATTVLDSTGKKVGHPIFTENNESFKSHEITYNFKTKKGYIKKITTKEGEGYILGKKVKKMRDDIFYFKKGEYTTCDAEKPHYSIRSNKIKLISGKKIITGPAYLTFFNIPTPLLFPFGYFPAHNKQSSGVLVPAYGESESLGFFLKNGGYYFAISDKLDLSIKSDLYSKGSWAIKTNLRYKNRYKYNGNLNLSYGNMINSEKGFPDYSIKKDFFIRWKHQQDPKANPSFIFSANVNAGSSTYHKNNSFNANDYLSNTFQSSISLTKRWDNLPINLSSNLRHSQNTQTKIVNLSFPDVNFNMNRVFPFKDIGKQDKTNWIDKIGVSYNVNIKNSLSIADSILFTKTSLANLRNGAQHNIPVSTSMKMFNYFTLSPKINLTERWYLSQIEKQWDGNQIITDTINKFTRGHEYQFSTSLNTKIYGILNFNKHKIKAIRHVITPNLSFNYKPDFSNNKYGYYKNVQIDSIGNTQAYSIMQNGIFGSPSNQKQGNININIGNILEMKVLNKNDSINNTRKIKLLESFNISSSYNIFKDSLNLSKISLNARTRLFDIININFSSYYDPYISNKQQNQNLNQFEISRNNRLARLTSFNTNIGLTINDKSFVKEENKKTETRSFYDIPWDLQANYSLTYNKNYKSSAFSDTIQSLNFSGNIKVTPKWKIGFRSGYDFDTKKLTYTSLDIYRDLHCWEMLFNWIPIGFHKSYTLTIRVKASILKDLKYEKRKDWFTPDYN